MENSHKQRWYQKRSYDMEDPLDKYRHDYEWSIAYHYIVHTDWTREKLRPLEQAAPATRNQKANWNGVHIWMVGNFQNRPPTDEQYKAVQYLVEELRNKYWHMPISWHRDRSPSADPGKYTDIKRFEPNNIKTWMNYLWVKQLSRYYSVMTGQKRYYNNKTYEDDFKMNCHGDCLSTAMSYRLSNKDQNKVVACDPNIWLWSRLYIEWVWRVQCVDRWWAIKWQRIDMYCWVWDWALDNWNSCKTWKRKVWLINEWDT